MPFTKPSIDVTHDYRIELNIYTLHSIESGPEFTLFLNTCGLEPVTPELKIYQVIDSQHKNSLCEHKIFLGFITLNVISHGVTSRL